MYCERARCYENAAGRRELKSKVTNCKVVLSQIGLQDEEEGAKLTSDLFLTQVGKQMKFLNNVRLSEKADVSKNFVLILGSVMLLREVFSDCSVPSSRKFEI